MTFGSLAGVLGMFAFVLGLLLLVLKVLRRFAPSGNRSPSSMPLEVVQRVALGPRQAIAVVRIGNQRVVVSVGDGGVHLIAHVTSLDDQLPPAPAATPYPADVRPARSTAFQRLLGSALRIPIAIGVLWATGATLANAQSARSAASPVTASATPPPVASATASPGEAQRPAAAPRPAPRASVPQVARVDTMLARLAPRLDLRVGNDQTSGLRLSGTVGIVVLMGLLTMLPMLVLTMTGFTRILIVLHFLRQAIGAQSAPPAQLVAGIALLLTGFVMAPTLSEVNRTALEPWMDGKIEQTQMLAAAVVPFRTFMLRQTRERDLKTFMDMSRMAPVARAEDVPLVVLVSAFVTSELSAAFQMGFALFLPFIVIDVVVASVLMSMGMMMLPPAMISLPFKLLLFVLVDGWSLVVQGIVQSFH